MRPISLILMSKQSRRANRWLSVSIFFTGYVQLSRNRNSSVDISDVFATVGQDFFSTRHRPNRLYGSPSLSPGTSPRAQRQGREADHSPPFSDQVKNGEAIPPLPNITSS
jgi:hypothetical protein